jgi:hypothetical protein
MPFASAPFSEPSPRAPAPGSTSAAAGATPPLLSGVEVGVPQLFLTLLSTEQVKALRQCSSGRHSPSPLRSESRCTPLLRRTFLSTERVKINTEPSPRAPAPGSTSAAAGATPLLLFGVKVGAPPASSNATLFKGALDGRNFDASTFSSEQSPRAPAPVSTAADHAAGGTPPSLGVKVSAPPATSNVSLLQAALDARALRGKGKAPPSVLPGGSATFP